MTDHLGDLPPELRDRIQADLSALEPLVAVVARLRAPGGCPWDIEQTHESLLPHLSEEAAEAVEAIESSDDAKMVEELGDLLLQILMHAEIAAGRGGFSLADIARKLEAKLVRRHPHVFGDVKADTPAEVLANWKQIKEAEKRATADGVPLESLSKDQWAEYLKG